MRSSSGRPTRRADTSGRRAPSATPAQVSDALIVTDARLRSGGVVDIHCDGGLVTEPFVDAHLHLDKVHTLPLIGDAALEAYTGAGMTNSARGIDLARAVKQHYRLDTLLPAVRSVLADGLRNGVLHVQA